MKKFSCRTELYVEALSRVRQSSDLASENGLEMVKELGECSIPTPGSGLVVISTHLDTLQAFSNYADRISKFGEIRNIILSFECYLPANKRYEDDTCIVMLQSSSESNKTHLHARAKRPGTAGWHAFRVLEQFLARAVWFFYIAELIDPKATDREIKIRSICGAGTTAVFPKQPAVLGRLATK